MKLLNILLCGKMSLSNEAHNKECPAGNRLDRKKTEITDGPMPDGS